MDEQFVPYELAVKLKELGIEFYHLGYYSLLEDNKIIESKFYASDDFLEAPLWEQAFDWLDREFGLFVSFDKVDNTRNFYYDFTIIDSKNRDYNDEDLIDSASRNLDKGKFDTYEEARFSCLEKLIELVETKKDSV